MYFIKPIDQSQEAGMAGKEVKMDKYSDIYKTRTNLFRYNYETERLEQMKRVIRKVNQGGTFSAVVLLDVLAEFEIDKARFEENPEYWVAFCESRITPETGLQSPYEPA